MEFGEVENILFQSEAIARIPDPWTQSIPFKCVMNGGQYHSFLYWRVSHGKADIKQLIGINAESKELIVKDAESLGQQFNLERLQYLSLKIEDYKAFWVKKRRYEKVYSDFCETDNPSETVRNELYQLFKELISEDMFKNLFMLIAKEFIQSIQPDTGNPDPEKTV